MLSSNGIGAVMTVSRETLSPEILRLIERDGPKKVLSKWKEAEEFSQVRGFSQAAGVYRQEALAIAKAHGIRT